MDRLCWLKVSVLICLFAVSGGRELKVKHEGHAAVYNHTLARILVEYASAVYMSDLTELFTWTCSRCTDMTEGFEMIELIVDVQYCLQAFVGVAHDLNSIVIAFRGTQEHSIQNWIEDLFWKQLDLNYPGMSDAMVHSGFYSAYHNTTVRLGVLNAVQRAQELYGEMGIMVTGHSMGGAMASFCALDLVVNNGAKNVQVMTFGQPRIGNLAFSSYFSKHVPNTIRVTNERDIVPHLPPYYSYFPQKTYHHFPRELVGLRGLKIETMISMRSLVEIGWAPILKQLISIPFLVDIDGALGGPNLFPLGAHPEIWPGLAMLTWSTGFGSLVYRVEKVCDGSGEDPSCSRSVAGNSISDHLEYFGAQLQAETWGSCRIVMDRGIIKLYGTEDNNNSFVLSRDPTTSVLMLRNQMGGKISSV